MRAITGHSDDPVTIDAIDDVLGQIEKDLKGETPKGAMLFCSVEYEHQVILDRIQAAYPGLPLVGATSDGEISSTLGFCDDSVLLTVFSGDDIRVHAGLGRDLSMGIDAAVDGATKGMGTIDPKLCLTTFAPSTDAAKVVKAIARRLDGAACPVLGGLSGDHREFERMGEFFGAEVCADSLPILFIEGQVDVSWGIGSGWKPTGPEMTVTGAEGNIVATIDGRPAMEVYKDYYDDIPSDFLGEFPLACSDEHGEWRLRASIFSDDDTGALTFAGAVAQGSTVRFTEVLEEGLLHGSESSLAHALDDFQGDSPQLALIFTCAARKWVLGTEAAKEIDLLRVLASDRGLDDLIFAGLYCFGEIAPNHVDSRDGFHNETCVSVVLG